ncbi:MAG: iron-siderophore ABC transporter substrate-binding protein [Actinomycetota bacterium]
MLGPLARHGRGALAAAALVLVAACGGSDSDSESTASDSGTATASASDSASASEPAASASDSASASEPASGEEEPATSDGSDETDTTEAPTTTAEPALFPRTVTDALGEVTIDEQPVRVVALDRSLIDAALALEVDLVGYTTFMDPEGDLPEYFGTALDDHAADATWVGDLLNPNLEAIAALDPDLILTAAVRHESIAPELSAIAPTVMTDSAGGGWKDNIRVSAEAVGKEDLGDELIADFEQQAADLGATIREVADDPTVSVVRFVDVVRLYQPISFSGTVLEDMGVRRPESQQRTDDFISVISEEEIDQADGDVVVYAVFDNEDVRAAVDQLLETGLWRTLDAVQRDAVYPVSDDAWMSGVGLFGARIILEDLATIFEVDPPG